jgi:hypothetical protein
MATYSFLRKHRSPTLPIYKSHVFVSNYILFYVQFRSLFVLVDVMDIVFQDKRMQRVVRFSREKHDTAPVMMTIENSREKQDNIVLHMGAIPWETPRGILNNHTVIIQGNFSTKTYKAS